MIVVEYMTEIIKMTKTLMRVIKDVATKRIDACSFRFLLPESRTVVHEIYIPRIDTSKNAAPDRTYVTNKTKA